MSIESDRKLRLSCVRTVLEHKPKISASDLIKEANKIYVWITAAKKVEP